MITRLKVQNFRCFDNLTIEGLKRFNLIVGDSGSGKTALLETLFLISSGGPEGYFRLRRWRGFGEGQMQLNGTKDSWEGLFRTLFHDPSHQALARIESQDSNFGKRSLDIYFEGDNSLSLSVKSPESSMRMKPIHFKWDVGNNPVCNLQVQIKEGNFKITGDPAEVYPLHFLSPKTSTSLFDAQLFSQLSKRSEARELIKTIAAIFPVVKDLSLEISGGETLIHVEREGFGEKIPLNELSGGLNKFVSIALAIAANGNGVVAVDEIEDGFYFKSHVPIIASLLTLCDKYKVQLFASTHSWEFLQAFAPALKGREADCSILRTSYEDKKCSVKVIGGVSSISAITQDIEIRN
jgi:ABC-type lipoprotein export system ATPase subunit